MAYTEQDSTNPNKSPARQKRELYVHFSYEISQACFLCFSHNKPTASTRLKETSPDEALQSVSASRPRSHKETEIHKRKRHRVQQILREGIPGFVPLGETET